MIRITAEGLALISGVGIATIRRYELMSGVPAGNARSVEAIQNALEEAGIEFVGTPEDRPGVRMRNK
jgi:hypothetical protein